MAPRIIRSNKSVFIPKITIQKLIFQCLKKYGDMDHLIEYETGKLSTFSQLLNDCLKLGAALLKLHLNPGEVIIIYGFNSYEFLVAYIAAMFAGATVMAMRALDTHYEVKSTLLLREAKFLFVTSEKRETAEFISDELPEFKNIILFESETDRKFVTLKQLIKNCSNGLNENTIYEPKNDNELAFLVESSGTSGAMKAIMLGHYDFSTVYCPENSVIPSENEVYSAHSHIAHLSGHTAHFRSIMNGKKLVSFRNANVDKVVDAIQKYRISNMVITPTFLNLLNKIDPPVDLSSLRALFVGGSRVPPNLMKSFREKYEIADFRIGYGMTEVTILITVVDNQTDYDSVGKVGPGIEMRVIDKETGKLLGENEVGELHVRGPIKFRGYHKNEKATREMLDEEGWIHTGDLGYFDKDEKFYIVDRIKDIIKQDGYSYSPVDIEDVLLQHNAVKEAAVIGIPYGIDQEISHGFVILKDEFSDGQVKEEDLLHFVNKRTSKIREVKGGLHYVSEIPKTDFGKIVRRKLRDHFLTNGKM